MMKTFNVPSREEVSPNNQAIFDKLQGALGFVPNLFATMAYSEHGLGNYLQFQNGKSSLSKKEKEVINLAVSQVNNCNYCLSAHTLLGKMNGFTDDQILEIRSGQVSFDGRIAALTQLVKELAENRGTPGTTALENFFAAGYTRENLVDVVLAIADKVVMNYLHNITGVAIDFPHAPALETEQAA